MANTDAKTKPMPIELSIAAQLADAAYTGVVPESVEPVDIDLSSLGFQLTSSTGRWWHSEAAVLVMTYRVEGLDLLVFGGTTAGPSVAEDSLERAWENRHAGVTQWMSNLRSGMGSVTDNLAVSLAVADHLERHSMSSPLLIGHSKGAAEASFVALNKGWPAKVFASPGLSDGVLASITYDSNTVDIDHWFVEGDSVVELCSKLPWMHQVGRQHPCSSDGSMNGIQCHIRFATAIAQHIEDNADE